MREFQWTAYTVPVKICGFEFELTCNSETADTLREMSNALKESAKNFKSLSMDDIVAVYSEYFDMLLGNGASAKIIGERKTSISDLNDLTYFLIDTYKEFNDRRADSAKRRESKN